MIFISSLEIIIVILRKAKSEGQQRPDVNIFLWIAASVASAAVVNLNGIKTLLAKILSTFPIKGNPIFSNSHKNLPENPDYPILCNWVFGNFVLADEPFEKTFWSLETFLATFSMFIILKWSNKKSTYSLKTCIN